MLRRYKWLTALMGAGVVATFAVAQTGTKSAGTQASSGSSSSGSAGLSGLSYVSGHWDTHMPEHGNQAMLCYKLVPTATAAQPFTLEPTIDRSDFTLTYSRHPGLVPLAV